MANNKRHLLHVRSSESNPKEYGGVQIPYPKLPSVTIEGEEVKSPLKHGEIAVNYGEGVESISILNSENEIVRFGSEAELEDVSSVLAGALAEMDETVSNLADQVDQLEDDIQHVGIAVDDELDDESENPVQNQVITNRLSEMERVTAEALNDLNTRVINNSESISNIAEDVKPFRVVFSDDPNTGNIGCDTSIADINAAYNDGKLVVGSYHNIDLYIMANTETGCMFNGMFANRVAYIAGSHTVGDDMWGLEYYDIPNSFDITPTSGSSKLVTSGGIYTALTGKADLVDGKVPAAQLPSYVDDVIEGTMSNGVFTPAVSGTNVQETGKIYVDTTTNKAYRWSGSVYVEVSPTPAIDNEPTENSANLISSGAVYTALQNAEIEVDDDLYLDSENPVQNKVIAERLEEMDEVYAAAFNDIEANKQDKLTIDDTLDDESENPVQNKVITERIAEMDMVFSEALNNLNDRLDGVQDELVFDNVPTENSTNPVTSGGVYNAISDSEDVIEGVMISGSFYTGVWENGTFRPTHDAVEPEAGVLYLDVVEHKLYHINADGLTPQHRVDYKEIVPTTSTSVAANNIHPVTSGAVYQAMEDNNLVISAALNELNDADINTNLTIQALRAEIAELRAIIEDLVTTNNLTSNLL